MGDVIMGIKTPEKRTIKIGRTDLAKVQANIKRIQMERQKQGKPIYEELSLREANLEEKEFLTPKIIYRRVVRCESQTHHFSFYNYKHEIFFV